MGNPDSNPALLEALRDAARSADLPDVGLTGSMLQAAKEIIFRVEDDGPHLQIVGFILDLNSGCLSLGPTFDIYGFSDDDDVKGTMAHAIAYDVPIYPENKSDIPRLLSYHQAIFADGFLVPGDEGNEGIRYRLTARAAHNLDLDDIDETTSFSPADYLLREMETRERLAELVQAEKVISDLRSALEILQGELDRETRDENALQRILTERPSLLGLEYRRLIPKHRLGSEYELDYAAITFSGFAHCIEIESSNLLLYTKAGNPRAELVHAEQQVLDWLDWLDQHVEYASTKLPSLLRPTGTVIIGRRTDMTEEDQKRLQRRNAGWNGTLRILTYDDLVDQGRLTLQWLTSGFAATSS